MVRMSKGIEGEKRKKKFARCRPENQSKGEAEMKESRDITGIIKKQEHQAREKEIHQFKMWDPETRSS